MSGLLEIENLSTCFDTAGQTVDDALLGTVLEGNRTARLDADHQRIGRRDQANEPCLFGIDRRKRPTLSDRSVLDLVPRRIYASDGHIFYEPFAVSQFFSVPTGAGETCNRWAG